MTKMNKGLLFSTVLAVAAVSAFPGTAHAVVRAPEIDPGSAFGALTLLSGMLAIVRGRRAGK